MGVARFGAAELLSSAAGCMVSRGSYGVATVAGRGTARRIRAGARYSKPGELTLRGTWSPRVAGRTAVPSDRRWPAPVRVAAQGGQLAGPDHRAATAPCTFGRPLNNVTGPPPRYAGPARGTGIGATT